VALEAARRDLELDSLDGSGIRYAVSLPVRGKQGRAYGVSEFVSGQELNARLNYHIILHVFTLRYRPSLKSCGPCPTELSHSKLGFPKRRKLRKQGERSKDTGLAPANHPASTPRYWVWHRRVHRIREADAITGAPSETQTVRVWRASTNRDHMAESTLGCRLHE
jgi:hypothetical protein